MTHPTAHLVNRYTQVGQDHHYHDGGHSAHPQCIIITLLGACDCLATYIYKVALSKEGSALILECISYILRLFVGLHSSFFPLCLNMTEFVKPMV